MLWGLRSHCTVNIDSLLRQRSAAKQHTLSTADVKNVWSCSFTSTPPTPIRLEDVMLNSTVDNKFSLYACYWDFLLILWESPYRNYICYGSHTVSSFVHKLSVNRSRNPPSLRNSKNVAVFVQSRCLSAPRAV